MGRSRAKQQKKLEAMRQQQMIDEEERDIAKYSKLLNLKKRKGNDLCKAFSSDGLADILEICESANQYVEQKTLEDVSKKRRCLKKSQTAVKTKKRKLPESNEVQPTPEVDNNAGGDSEEPEHQLNEKCPPEPESSETPKRDVKDIDEEDEESVRIKKLLKSSVNKLTECNIVPIYRELESLFRKNSKRQVKQAFVNILYDACCGAFKISNRVLATSALLVAVLHSKLDAAFTALLVEHFVTRLEERRAKCDDAEDGCFSLNNGYQLIGYLAELKVVGCNLVLGILNAMLLTYTAKDIELLIHVIRAHGFMLRKASPSELKNLIALAQMQANKTEHSSRVKALGNALIDDLNCVKNNNASKLNSYDPEIVEHAVRTLRSLLRGVSVEPAITFGLQDILDAPVKGRWWIVGSAFDTDKFKQNKALKPLELVTAQCSNELLSLAEKNKMNTDIRRAIFCTIMTSEDYLDAMEKLLRLNLKDPQDREIIHILFICCQNERHYNPFYGLVVQSFCKYHRRFARTAQFAIWDRMKVLHTLKRFQQQNFASLVSSLLGSLLLPITVFKAVNFAQIDDCSKRFLKWTFTALLLENSDETLKACFERLNTKSEFRLLRSGIRLFMQHFLLSSDDKDSLNRKTDMIVKVLISPDNYYL